MYLVKSARYLFKKIAHLYSINTWYQAMIPLLMISTVLRIKHFPRIDWFYISQSRNEPSFVDLSCKSGRSSDSSTSWSRRVSIDLSSIAIYESNKLQIHIILSIIKARDLGRSSYCTPPHETEISISADI